MAYDSSWSGTTPDCSEKYTPYIAGPTGRCGRRDSRGLMVKQKYPENLIGIFGSELRPISVMSKSWCPLTGADGGITARAHSVTWAATSLNLQSVCWD